ncbi:3-methyladenine DNA glycosylase [Nibricoccus aquaticus]|uniref:Putative 3-methyladenine DNA glycosylase n=1 Tax=Nibricoccus aquaticus TaxID=2576891 RepID=A0A290Q972_9BACT|nr:DNA-3-methyladenine glycosylase [Nibricoccus aquaticus]ATC62796.1 3-methyladenine DNA glycosylase [Nibricoccus aquaticus]
MPEILQAKVFQRVNTVAVARGLIGRVLVRRREDGSVTRHVITETEAYCGEEDLACHARAGRTARTEVMYRAGGVWYVYLCYGIHEMLNLVTGPEDFPAAVLIRGVADAKGPGRLTKRLEIGRALNGLAATEESGLWIEEGQRVPGNRIQATPRVGVDFAGAEWAGKPWRFVLKPTEVKEVKKT